MKRPPRPIPITSLTPRGGGATTPRWLTAGEVARTTGHSLHALYERIRKGQLVARKVPGKFSEYEWLIDWCHAEKHLPAYRESSARKGQKEPISDETWQRFLVVFDKFLRGECEPAPSGHPVRRR